MEQNGPNHEALWKKHLCLIFQKHIFLTVQLHHQSILLLFCCWAVESVPDPRTRWNVALQDTTANFKELFGYIISNSNMILYSSRLKLLRPPAVPLRLDYNINSIRVILHGGASWVTSCGFVIWALPRFFCDWLCREESERSVKKQWEGMQQSIIGPQERAFVPLFMASSG